MNIRTESKNIIIIIIIIIMYIEALLYVNAYIHTYAYQYTMEWGESGLNCWGIRGPALVLFLIYVNVSGMHPRSCLSSHLLPIMAFGVSSGSGGL